MSSGNQANFWLKDNKKSLGDSFNRITNFRLPEQKKPDKDDVKSNKNELTNSYIRLEQIDEAYTNYPYSMFLEEVVTFGNQSSEPAVSAMDLFIRCLKPNLNVSCHFNRILRAGTVELERSEDTVRAFECGCHELNSLSGKALIISKNISFEVSFNGQFLQMKNIEGLSLGMDIEEQLVQANVHTVSFRVFNQKNCVQVVSTDNPLYTPGSKMKKELSFLRVTAV